MLLGVLLVGWDLWLQLSLETHIFLNRKQQMTRLTIALTPPMIEHNIVTTSNAMEAERGNWLHLEQRGTQSPLLSQ